MGTRLIVMLQVVVYATALIALADKYNRMQARLTELEAKVKEQHVQLIQHNAYFQVLEDIATWQRYSED